MTGNIFLPLKPKLMKIEIYTGISHCLRLELERAQIFGLRASSGLGFRLEPGPFLRLLGFQAQNSLCLLHKKIIFAQLSDIGPCRAC